MYVVELASVDSELFDICEAVIDFDKFSLLQEATVLSPVAALGSGNLLPSTDASSLAALIKSDDYRNALQSC